MQKRAQITIFIAMGAALLLGLLFFVYMRSTAEETSQTQLESPKDILPIRTFVDSCVEQSLSDGIEYVAMQGGYYESPNLSISFGLAKIPYYYSYENFNTVPKLSSVEAQLANFVDFVLPKCTNDFKAFTEIGFTVTSQPPVSTITISKGHVMADVQYPLQIKKAGVSYDLQSFSASKESVLNDMYNYSAQMVKKIEENPDYVPISYIMDMAYNNHFFSEVIYLDNGTVVFSIIRNTTLPSLYSFAVKYSWNNRQDSLPHIGDLPELNATVGYQFRYQINFSPNDSKLSAYTGLFNISSSGVIDFMPVYANKGLHSIVIRAEKNGRSTAKMLRLRIVSENLPPILKRIPNQIINAGQKLTYQLYAIDPDNDTIFYSLQSNVENLSVNLLTGSFEHTFNTKGIFNVTAIVVDINGAAIKQLFKVIVK